MIGAIASLGGMLGAGGILGLLKIGIEFWMESKRAKSDADHRERLALGNQLVEYTNAIHGKSQEVDLEKNTNWTITWKGQPLFSYESKHRKEKIAHSLSSWAHCAALLMLVGALVWCCLIWANVPNIPVWSHNPGESPTTIKVLFGIIEWSVSKNTISEISTGGMAYALLHGIMGIAGYVLVGTRFNKK